MISHITNNIIMNSLTFMIMIINVLIGVAFLTLMERKILSMMQLRKGPNKNSIIGILQPFNDAIKLFSKEMIFIKNSNKLLFYMSPMMMFLIMLMLWLSYPMVTNFIKMNFSMLYILCLLSLNSFPAMMSGWSSNSNYPLLGAIRSIAQTISFEVSMIIMMMSPMFLSESFKLININFSQKYMWFMFSMIPIFLMFFISIIAEMNRSPFDLIESESELVSGFNTEFHSSSFSIIFMSEYTSIIYMSMITTTIFTNIMPMNIMFWLMMMLFSFSIIWMRGTLPRIRYDELMYLCWKIFLPSSIIYLMMMISMKNMYFLLI